MPRIPQRKPRDSGDDARGAARPYTQWMLLGLQTGLALSDIREMKYTHLVQTVYAWQDMHGVEYDEVREATGADTRLLKEMN